MTAPRVVLASASPRRARLLAAASIPFDVEATYVDERVDAEAVPVVAAVELAVRKALAAQPRGRWVVAADTLIDLDGVIVGKPRDAKDAESILARLSGREHWVITGVAVRRHETIATGLEQTRVTFRQLAAEEIARYVATGEPLDKAGAYAIQGGAAGFVAHLQGSMDNVIGLPMDVVRRLLAETGFPN